LLDLWHDHNRTNAQVKSLTQRHIAEIESKVKELESMRNTLAMLSENCHGNDRPECPILEDLASLNFGN
jgi:DNA-binding transcriptional MerR regulator